MAEHPYVLPVLAALAAAIPCFSFTYLWDDYFFLNHVLRGGLADFAPISLPHDPFYRPISRGLYFSLLEPIGNAGPLVGHILNACMLAAAVLLLVLLAQRLAGKRAAVFAGLAFALLGPTPFLVGWVSGVQDLLGMVFILAAIHLQLSRRTAAAIAATALSLLSKETAVALVPVLAGLDWCLGRKPYRLPERIAAYGALVGLWALVHPGVKLLIAHGLRSGATTYVGAEHAERWLPYLGRYLVTMMNIPTSTIDAAWVVQRGAVLAVLAVVTALAFKALGESRGKDRGAEWVPTRRIVGLGVLLAALPLVLVSMMLRAWAPYYSVFPTIGSSLLLGIAIARAPKRWAGIGLAAFLALGFVCRGGKFEPGVPTEYNLSLTSPALRKVEHGFKALHATLPAGSQILVSVQAAGMSGLYTHLYLFQALRVWYREATLQTMRPDWRRPMQGAELLFWVSTTQDVFEINPITLESRTSGPQPDYREYQKTLRYYARGLAASGGTDRGLQILLNMKEQDEVMLFVDCRMAAMLLFQDGRDRDAQMILGRIPPLPREGALIALTNILANPGGAHPWDDAALRAFDLAPDDASVWRDLMRRFENPLYSSDGIRFAQRLLRLEPGDAEATKLIQQLSLYAEIAPIAMPAPPD